MSIESKFDFYQSLRQSLSDVDWYADILDFFIHRNLKPDGTLSGAYPAERGRAVYKDWDDILPGALLFGHYDFFLNQLNLTAPHLYMGLPILDNDIIYGWRIDEYIGGLIELTAYQPNPLIDTRLKEALHGFQTNMLIDDKIFIGVFDTKSDRQPPIEYARNGGTIEVLLSTDLESTAYDILNRWAENPFFLKYGLFPDKWIGKDSILSQIALTGHVFRQPRAPFQTSSSSLLRTSFQRLKMWYPSVIASLMKDNSNLIYAFIAAWKISSNPTYAQVITTWCDALLDKLVKDGFARQYWTPTQLSDSVRLSQNFTLIDILCDVYALVEPNSQYIESACTIAQNWIDERWETGIVPSQLNSEEAIIDDQTDFSVSLVRLAELTGDTKWKTFAHEIIASAKKMFYTPKGLVTLSVRSHNDMMTDRIATKYNFLFAKALVALQTESKIYDEDSDFLWEFLQDR